MLFWSLVFCLAGETLGSTANAKACCAAAGVSSWCVENFCNAEASGFDVTNNVAARCALNRTILGVIARRLADGRNHLPCCQSQATDYLSCLHLCNGTAPSVDTSTWIPEIRRFYRNSSFADYSGCVSVNLYYLKKCIRGGYASGPFPPKSVNARPITPTEALITWEPPENLPDRVKEYVASYRNTAGFTRTEDSSATNETSVALGNLNPDTEYEVNVVAKAKTGLTDSLPSKVVFVTGGIPPMSFPWTKEIFAGQHATVTLACQHIVRGSQHISNVAMEWLKSSGSEYHPVDVTRKLDANRTKFADKHYVSRRHGHGATDFVHTLKIIDIESSDFGSYKCASKNPFGEASGVVSLKQATSVMPAAPRNSTACCLSETQRTGCQNASCNLSDDGDVRLPAGQEECAVIETVAKLRCPIHGINLTTCCLREEVHPRCLYYCNGQEQQLDRISMLSIAAAGCLDYYRTSIAQCNLESREGIPNPPSNVEVTASIHVSWEAVPNANLYVVYNRVDEDDWKFDDTFDTSITLPDSTRSGRHQIIVQSATGAGVSENSESAYITIA